MTLQIWPKKKKQTTKAWSGKKHGAYNKLIEYTYIEACHQSTRPTGHPGMCEPASRVVFDVRQYLQYLRYMAGLLIFPVGYTNIYHQLEHNTGAWHPMPLLHLKTYPLLESFTSFFLNRSINMVWNNAVWYAVIIIKVGGNGTGQVTFIWYVWLESQISCSPNIEFPI